MRIVPSILFILFIMVLFFSFRLLIRGDEMQRAGMQLGDTLSGTLADERSIFTPEKLNRLETEKNIELYADTCEFGYTLNIESIGKTVCKEDSGCRAFCDSACGAGSECNCNFELFSTDFCECKKGDRWTDKYQWRLGISPSDTIKSEKQKLPSGLFVADTAIPASLEITVYDSFLTRITCATKKAYETKTPAAFSFGQSYLPKTENGNPPWFGRKDDNLCITTGLASECRYAPGIPVEDFDLVRASADYLNSQNGIITAYPLKAKAECADVEDDLIAGPADTVEIVLLCAKAVG